MPRDRIEEILRQRSRQHSHGQRFDRFNRRMYPIMRATLELPRCTQMSRASKAELMRYFPIATVGALEGYFRALYADLINAGDPYAERAQSFPGVKRLDAITSEAKARKVSTGDLIAHQLRHNSFADVCDNLTTLLGADFLSLLRSPPVAAIGFMGWGRDYFPHVTGQLRRLFDFRHVFCHELATKVKLTAKQVVELSRCGVFLAMTTDILMMDFVGTDASKQR